ncbi:MAG: AMP-binding protein [Dehalococcoidales bacterium]
MTIAEMLARNARMYPKDIALVELTPSKNFRREITWKDFDDRANRVANALIKRGIHKGDKVLHLMMNSINWLEVYFGIVRTGAWVVPLNFRFGAKEIKYCAEIAEAKAIIFSEQFIERVQAVRHELPNIKHYIYVGENPPPKVELFEDVIAGGSPQPTGVELLDTDPCGLYFTSGTTGDPKPILLTHRNMESTAITENRHHLQTHEDNYILLPPLYHTGAKMHWFGNLIVGGKAVILTEIKPQYIIEAVHRERGTIVWLLVPWLHDIIQAFDNGELKIKDYDLSCWRLMHVGAQPVPVSLIKRWKQYFPDMQYDDNYGLTESTGPGCLHLGMENQYKLGANGKAGFNWELRIVNDNDEDVKPGSPGELIARGNGVMKEYYKNPQLTAQTLKNGWLHTGDVARTDEDGFIYVIDRKKDVIITGGENIYPVEIESVIHQYTGVKDVAVIRMPDERLGEIAAAVIEAQPDVTLSEEEILEHCKKNLPNYQRPRKIIFNKVPRNPTGKLEKTKLRQKYSGE